MRCLLLLMALGLFPWVSVFANAGETLRVVLIQNDPQATLTAPEGLFVKKTSGETLYFNPFPAIVLGVQEGVSVNGLDTLEKELIFIPKKGRLSVNQHPYAGRVRVKKGSGLLVVNEVDVEDYLKGVVPAEMPSEWEMEALEVQAIISRTYALYQKQGREGKDFDLSATVLSQVYHGESVANDRATLAIEATEGKVVTYNGTLAVTFFHSTSAGPTENAGQRWNTPAPYLNGVSCPLDRGSPYYQWKRVFPLEEMEGVIRKMGHPIQSLTGLIPLTWSKAGRILTLRVDHTQGQFVINADHLRAALGYKLLPSTHFQIDAFGTEIKISGMGYGHGVGLCQWGAKVMAEQGLKSEEILAYYYPGTTLQSYEALTR